VILIITDDQGYGDVAANGNKVIKTPNMDKLYHEGVRFTNFHAGTTCAPSRSGLMAGIDGNRAGVWHTIGGCNFLRDKFTIMPQVFQANGYCTAMYGKWHLGDAYPYLPEDRGFEETVVHGGGGVGQTPDYWNNDYFDDTYWHNGKPQQYKGYCTDVFFGEAMKYIESKKNKPFFVYISTNAPHGPLNVEKKYYDLYKDETSITDDQKAFYGMITNIDDNMGFLDKKLEELGLKENTIVIFTTDNGTASGYKTSKDGEMGFNAQMRGTKGSQYEGGHRVPFFIRWQNGKLVGGESINELTMNFDILPTLIDLCQLKNNFKTDFDGINLAPRLTKKVASLPQRYCVVDNNRQQQPEKWHMCSVMDNEWRLVDGKELYNLQSDPGEATNIATKYPERVTAMRAAYEKWWEHTSVDFSQYEAYKVGVSNETETILTAMDFHTSDPQAWDQELIRDPLGGKKPALSKGYWMIDVQHDGDYEITLRRWPSESGLRFNQVAPALGEQTKWYNALPKGTVFNIEKATIDLDALHLEQKVDMSSDKVVFRAHINKGRKQLYANLITDKNDEFSAFYVYIKKIDRLK